MPPTTPQDIYSYFRLCKKGVQSILQGNPSEITDWLKVQQDEQLNRWLGADPTAAAATFPSWLVAPETGKIIRHIIKKSQSGRIEGHTSEWLTVLDQSTGTNCRVETEEPIKQIDVPITGSSATDSFSVEVEADTESGTVEHHGQFKNSDSYDVGDVIEFSFDFDQPVTDAEISVTPEYKKTPKRLSSLVCPRRKYKPKHITQIAQPAPRPVDDSTPIFLISIDALRYDYLDELAPLVDTLGEDAYVPEEPRTQGHWTPVSHASMFTGVHPGEHNLVGYGPWAERHIHSELPTISELLAENLYKCSALISNPQIIPELGFGTGFYRFKMNKMNHFPPRDNDARENVNQIIKWVDSDLDGSSNRLFYFMHVLDPHQPYLPPLPRASEQKIDAEILKQFANETTKDGGGSGKDYIKLYKGELTIDSEIIDTIKQYYSETARDTATQVSRLVEHLKRKEIFDESLIIITGDHGEEFGERGFYGHNSLYDANIRPFTAIKPPADAAWTVPDETNTIDFLPTIATEIGATPPDHCQGQAWQTADTDRTPRITERIHEDWYNLAVEVEGIKAIFTYESNGRNRPDEEVIDRGPHQVEYYELEAVRHGVFDDCGKSVSDELKNLLQAEAESFMKGNKLIGTTEKTKRSVPDDLEAQLEHLGYR